ncbi:hypothetical protein MsAg5_07200 [Methanosarcinaceae archaeon Ag5]|uniref:Fido domain-containing protein n=1 Tax=Methanolapillus africanus TaxID=3028297 RepID=A0AAE4SF08_9EURY|nr:hypothetical protein [Methanosarcinaceae archaeon Ag5]
MDVADKKYFMKFNDATGRKLRPLANAFEEDFKTGSDLDEADNDILMSLAFYLWNLDGKADVIREKSGEKEAVLYEPTVDEIERAMSAYHVAFEKELTEKNFHEAVHYLSDILSGPNKKTPRVEYRRVPVAIFNGRGKRVYTPPEPEYVGALMASVFNQTVLLLKQDLSVSEIFYHAALIHLKVIQIHPFIKNNVKATVLLEKWFLKEKLGNCFIKLPSEKYYFENKDRYNVNTLTGSAFNNIDDDRCLPFLLMLPESLKIRDI